MIPKRKIVNFNAKNENVNSCYKEDRFYPDKYKYLLYDMQIK